MSRQLRDRLGAAAKLGPQICDFLSSSLRRHPWVAFAALILRELARGLPVHRLSFEQLEAGLFAFRVMPTSFCAIGYRTPVVGAPH